ncbi:hypothetical protein KR032_006024, partial [Drosophila birchii]
VVHVKPSLHCESGLNKPDLVALRQNHIYVIDAQIVTDGHSIDNAHQRKVDRYDRQDVRTELLRRFGETSGIEFHSATLNWRGIWSSQSVKRLITKDLLTTGDCNIISVRVVKGGISCILCIGMHKIGECVMEGTSFKLKACYLGITSKTSQKRHHMRRLLTLMFSFIQANCSRGRAAIIELVVRLRRSGSMFALVQEPYLGGDGMDVLPEGTRMFTDRLGKAAILVDQQDAICMPVETLTNEYGVCLVVRGSFGSIFLCSAYCQFDAPLEPYHRYMDGVLLQASRT